MTIIYEQYISSPEWRERREQRLKIDQYRCRTCGITENLECHHVHYNNFGKEPMEDLITLCRECHEAITSVHRSRRYGKLTEVDPEHKTERIKVKSNVENYNISVEINLSPVNAQRPISRPTE